MTQEKLPETLAGKTIAIAGNIGTGKSSLVEFLTRTYGIKPFYEPNEENPYLSDFYQDMSGWAFHSQLYFLSNKFRMHQRLERSRGVVVLDRTIYEDAEIFARNLYQQEDMNERDWASYMDLYRTLTLLLKPPDLVIYLKASVPTLRRRILSRGRDFEHGIAGEYLERLNKLYDEWADNFSLSPVLIIDTNNLDYIQYEEHLEQIWQSIEHRLQGKDFLALQ